MFLGWAVIAALGAMLAWGIGDFLIQKGVRKIGDVETLAVIGVLGTIALLPFVFNEVISLLSTPYFFTLIIFGIIVFIISLFNFEALKVGKLSVVEVVLEIELPLVVILGFAFFREYLSVRQLALILLVFIGVILMAVKTNKFKIKWTLEKGVFLALLTAIGLGVVDYLTAHFSREISPLIAIWFPWLIFTIGCLAVIGKREGYKQFIRNAGKNKTLLVSLAVFDTLAWILYAFALVDQELAIVTAITESYVAVALFLGLWFNKERIHRHQYIGAALAVGASIALAFVS